MSHSSITLPTHVQWNAHGKMTEWATKTNNHCIKPIKMYPKLHKNFKKKNPIWLSTRAHIFPNVYPM